MRLPSMIKSPEEISSKPAIIRKVVDFPQPEGPTKAMNSFGSTSKLKFVTAFLSAPLYCLQTFFNSIKLMLFSPPYCRSIRPLQQFVLRIMRR